MLSDKCYTQRQAYEISNPDIGLFQLCSSEAEPPEGRSEKGEALLQNRLYTHGLIRAAFARVYGFTTIFPDILTLFQMLCVARVSRRGNAQWRKSQKWDSPKVTTSSSLIPQVGKLTCTYPWICIHRLAPRQL